MFRQSTPSPGLHRALPVLESEESMRKALRRFAILPIFALLCGLGSAESRSAGPSQIAFADSGRLVAGPNVQVDDQPATAFGEPFVAASDANPNALLGTSMFFGTRTWDARTFVSENGGYDWAPSYPHPDVPGGADVQVAFSVRGTAIFTMLGERRDPTAPGGLP